MLDVPYGAEVHWATCPKWVLQTPLITAALPEGLFLFFLALSQQPLLHNWKGVVLFMASFISYSLLVRIKKLVFFVFGASEGEIWAITILWLDYHDCSILNPHQTAKVSLTVDDRNSYQLHHILNRLDNVYRWKAGRDKFLWHEPKTPSSPNQVHGEWCAAQ